MKASIKALLFSLIVVMVTGCGVSTTNEIPSLASLKQPLTIRTFCTWTDPAGQTALYSINPAYKCGTATDGQVILQMGLLNGLIVQSTTAGTTPQSGLVEVIVNNHPTMIQCTLGTALVCGDSAHWFPVHQDDTVTVEIAGAPAGSGFTVYLGTQKGTL